MRLQQILDRLHNVKRSGAGFIALCPSHEDREPSLSITETEGKILLKCHAGCTVDETCAALGIKLRDLFPPPPSGVAARQSGRGASKRGGVADVATETGVGPRSRPPTLAQFAEAKKLPIDWLKEQGLIDHPDGGIVIGYFDAQGEQVPRQRLRTALRAGDGSSWIGPHEVKLIPFGLWRLNDATK